MRTPLPAIVPLSVVCDAEVRLVGGKAHGFAAIARARLPMPDGFVVTTAVHAAARADSGRVPAPVAARVAELVQTLGDAPLAVRSSAVGEDGAQHSHAGQYLTRLGVRGSSAALDAILACWASAAEGPARAYRAANGHGDDPGAMAVIVQRLVEAEAAGVAMSADPVTGDRDVFVVNAAPGLGEPVVSGAVTPDDYRIARDDGRLLAYAEGDRDVMLAMGPHGPAEVPVPPRLREGPVLSGAALAAVRRGLLACEAALGRPVDCEFAVSGGAVVWLQCRPITALAGAGAGA